tara:strand:+ start:554 stop:796 length:243 start_codon:yes stop_codon:yes gene_type:complete
MNFISKIIIRIIKIYQLFISPYLGNNCRFLPTCSEYFIGSIKNHGLIKGLFFGFKRLSSCHPIKVLGAKEGFDPVKKKGS